MKKIKLVLVLIFILSETTVAAIETSSLKDQFTIKVEKNKAHIQLPELAVKALKQWNKNFNVYELADYSPSVLDVFGDKAMVPMAYIADVDGDQISDIVLLGEDKKKQSVVAILNKKTKFEVIEIKSWGEGTVKKSKIPLLGSENKKDERGVPVYIAEPQGDVVDKIKNKKGIQIENYLGSTEVYSVEDNKSNLVAK